MESVIPSCLYATTTLNFSFSPGERTAANGWSARAFVKLQGTNAEKSGTFSSGQWEFNFTSADTSWPTGRATLLVVVEKGTDRFIVAERDLEILPDPLSGSRVESSLEKELALIDEAISAVLAGKGVQSYQIQTPAGMRLASNMSLADLREHRNWLQRRIDGMTKAPGKSAWRPIGTRFRD